MKILIADDQAEVRSALKVLLEQENELYTFDEAEEISCLMRKIEMNRPDLMLLDWELSNQPMSAMVPVLRQLVPELRIIAMSGRPEAAKAALEMDGKEVEGRTIVVNMAKPRENRPAGGGGGFRGGDRGGFRRDR